MTATSGDSLDTNILFYSIDVSDQVKHARARRLVDTLAVHRGRVALQALNELYAASVRKRILPPAVVQAYIESLLLRMQVVPASDVDLIVAMRLHQTARIQFFDALLIATCSRAGCRNFYTEDLQAGQKFGAMQVVNPFALSDEEFDQLIV